MHPPSDDLKLKDSQPYGPRGFVLKVIDWLILTLQILHESILGPFYYKRFVVLF